MGDASRVRSAGYKPVGRLRLPMAAPVSCLPRAHNCSLQHVTARWRRSQLWRITSTRRRLKDVVVKAVVGAATLRNGSRERAALHIASLRVWERHRDTVLRLGALSVRAARTVWT